MLLEDRLQEAKYFLVTLPDAIIFRATGQMKKRSPRTSRARLMVVDAPFRASGSSLAARVAFASEVCASWKIVPLLRPSCRFNELRAPPVSQALKKAAISVLAASDVSKICLMMLNASFDTLCEFRIAIAAGHAKNCGPSISDAPSSVTRVPGPQ